MNFPTHVNLTLEHNPHKSVYESIEQYMGSKNAELADDWVSPEEMKLAYETQDFWTCQWYPRTPIGFCIKHAHSLEVLLEYLENVDRPVFAVADTKGITKTTFSLVEPEFPKYHVGITHDIAAKGNQSSPIYMPREECSYCSPKLTPEEQGRIDMLAKEKP